VNQLIGKVAVVTGGGQALGEAAARRLAREGAKVVVVDTDSAAGAATVKAIREAGGTAILVTADVAAPNEAVRVVAETLKAFGQLDVLVNAVQPATAWKSFAEKDDADFDAVCASVLGAQRMMKAAYPQLRESGAARVVNVASAYGATSYLDVTDHVARDGALQGLSRAVAVEWGRDNITVNFLVPGLIDTPEFRRWHAAHPQRTDKLVKGVAMQRLGDPLEDFGGALMFLVSDEGCFVTGHPVYADGGQHLSAPAFEPGMRG